jgi:hypothetical protein
MADLVSSDIPDEDRSRVIERPDGFYWLNEATGKQYGPFPTLLAAVQDKQGTGDGEELEEGESLEEAEAEIGISDWIDPDTGMPAEGTTSRFPDE